MNKRHTSLLLCCALTCLLVPALCAAAVSIQLQPVLTGLSSPLYVTSAHDSSNRLFVVEQGGMIKVLQPGASTPTVFLDISSRVVFGGEQGLLGLAFHPQFTMNPSFYVDYTRAGDGATVIAEYHVSATNPNLADPTETILLTIPQPFVNHNGGMVEFGPDGFLYIGMGDGGSGNDPGNRAQNTSVLLGKILRIDVDHPNGAVPYSSPPTNPFFSGGGQPEIYAIGMRNPFRFSFDRGTGQLYVGDVGQGAWEEVDIVTLGGNYGWRIFEGNHCTNNDPALCANTSGFTFPIAEYPHAQTSPAVAARCSITGGYVYRGTRGSLPMGTYVFSDFCSGEIVMLSGGVQTVLLNSGVNVSSFGEDEGGEIYVVGLGGTVERIAAATPTCTVSISPTNESFASGGGTGNVTVTAPMGCLWTVASNSPSITILSGSSGTGNGTVNFSVAANSSSNPLAGTLSISNQTFTMVQGAQFNDVPPNHPFFTFIGKFSARGISVGCGNSNFCPDSLVTREQMALFLERAMGITNPPVPAKPTFTDVGPGNFSYPFIEDLFRRGITPGCSLKPAMYCPASPVTREQMAVSVEKALGVFNPPVPSQQTFTDVPAGLPSFPFIEDFFARGITAGCAINPRMYCPGSVLTRGQMAVFLVRAFGL
ncbi:MAG: PQQ-dependent sugar dehydrogenase [Acidobacteriia bacterium]|nr:PQQ-dependent sugar dehydrogenase [Terriglobia bacterium]